MTARNRQGGGALFSTTGIDVRTSSQLLYTLNNVLQSLNPSGTETIFNTSRTFTSGVFTNYLTGGADNVDGAIYLRLFEPLVGVTQDVKSFTTSLHRDHGEVNQGRWWRVVYMKNGILTLWMADPYRNMTGSNFEPVVTVRNALLTDFMGTTNGTISTTAGVLANYPTSVHNAIARSGSVASHQSQPTTTFNDVNYTNPQPDDKHYSWLPSLHEVEILWNLSELNKKCMAGGFYTLSWLRSEYHPSLKPALENDGRCAICNKYASTSSYPWRHQWDHFWALTDSSGYSARTSWDQKIYYSGTVSCYHQTPAEMADTSIRPAIHIDLNQLPPMDTSYVGDARISVGVEVG